MTRKNDADAAQADGETETGRRSAASAPPAKNTSPDPEPMTEKVHQVLSDHGIDADAIDTLGKQFLDELVTLQKEKPLVVLLGAFALGCVVGRALR